MSIKRGLRKLANTRLGQAITPPPPATGGGVSRRNLGMVAAVGMFGAGQRETNPLITRSGTGGLTPAPQNAPGANAPAVGVQPGQTAPPNIINIYPGRPELVYDPSPGPGNLFASFAATAGTDHGNAYLAGLTVYTSTTATQFVNGSIVFYTAASQAGPWVQEAVEFFGQILTNPSTEGFTLDNISLSGVLASRLQLAQGFSVFASNPSAANQNTIELWHPMTLLNSWTSGGRISPEYRLLASPANEVELAASFTAPAGIAAGQAIWNAPTGYVNTDPQSAIGRNQTTNAPVMFSVTGGQLSYQSGAVSGNIIDLHTFVSLDA